MDTDETEFVADDTDQDEVDVALDDDIPAQTGPLDYHEAQRLHQQSIDASQIVGMSGQLGAGQVSLPTDMGDDLVTLGDAEGFIAPDATLDGDSPVSKEGASTVDEQTLRGDL